jgi:hypothetical protein
MAVREPIVTKNMARNGGVVWAQWTGLLNGDTGDWVGEPDYCLRTFQVFGTFGSGGSVSIDGSNDQTPTNYAVLSNWQGTALTTNAATFLTSRDLPMWVRPRVTAGDGTTNLTVTMAAHRQDMGDIG